jgi:LacI family transcriptional regulator
MPKRRKRGPRFAEIAALAGVSQATVDRVLNERDSVAEATRRRVLAAAERLGVPRILPRADHALVHLDILLPRSKTPFFQRLAAALRDGGAMLDRRIVVHRTLLPENDAAGMAAALRHPPRPRAGFILAAPDLPEIRSAALEGLARGEHGVSVVTELPGLPGLAYVGIDNRRAGMVAGYLTGRLTAAAGQVVLLGSLPSFRAHRDRHDGFREALAEFPHLVVDAIDVSTGDDADRCFHAIRTALARGGLPVVGIYNSGAGSGGIAKALAAHPGARPTWIGHEISDDHADYLRRGLMDAALDQDPAGQAIAALQTLLHAVGVTDQPPSSSRGELRVYTRHVLP